jgi:DNA-directed RNA polymerase alpha subunit
MKAFPNPNNTKQEGMDLRDWFAGLAMQGIVMDGSLNSVEFSLKAALGSEISKLAYQIADAMMASKGKPKMPRLEDLNLTQRIKNVLRVANIHTVEDLLKQQRFLYKEPNIGRVSLIHIKIELLKYGIEFDFTPAPRQMKLL